MDAENYNNIKRLQPNSSKAKIEMILNYSHPGENRQVPDPYYEGGFDKVFNMLMEACKKVTYSIK